MGLPAEPVRIRKPKPDRSDAASRLPRLNEDTVGDYFVRADGTLWRHISYADRPTATLEHVADDRSDIAGAQRVGGVVGAPIFAGFRRLVPEALDA
jgi:hypothetical protein